jgi:cyclic di-GMP phosphodiesterase
MSSASDVPRILIVDDEEQNRALLADLLALEGCVCEEAADGFEALAKIMLDIDVVLLDIMMPNMDGFEVIRRVRENPATADIPIIMVTALGGQAEKVRALEAGAYDFLTKPVDHIELRARTKAALRAKRAQDALKSANEHLESKVNERTTELRNALSEMAKSKRTTHEAHLDTIRRLAIAAEFKDAETAEHIYRMAGYSRELGVLMGLTSTEADALYFGSLMHDVGKIGTPDSILLKPGKLTPEERAVMETHTVIGSRILSNSESPLIRIGESIALNHHEWWNGSGYPRQVHHEEIPLYGRICAISDVYDALMSKRPYKPAFTIEKALEILHEGRATHFDPELFDLFESHLDEITERKEPSSYALYGTQVS